MPTTEARPVADWVPEKAPRSRWSIPVLLVVALAAVAGVVAALLLIGGDDAADPEEVVVESLEAYIARDIAALAEVLDPNVVITFDTSRVGGFFLPDEVGRDAIIEMNQEFWANVDPALTYTVLAVDGREVTTSEEARLPDGTISRHTTTYFVSEDGLITRMDHVIEE